MLSTWRQRVNEKWAVYVAKLLADIHVYNAANESQKLASSHWIHKLVPVGQLHERITIVCTC